jgi:hypothetical protein
MVRGEMLINWLDETYEHKREGRSGPLPKRQWAVPEEAPAHEGPAIPGLEFTRPGLGWEEVDLFGVSRAPVPYPVFRSRLDELLREENQGAACASQQAASCTN